MQDPDTIDAEDEPPPFTPNWNLVMIVDDPDNACTPDAPGADVDAVELYRNEALIAWAESVEALESGDGAPCGEVTASDPIPEEVLGAPDGARDMGYYEGVYPLRGATIYLRLSEPMMNGDTLVIHELDPEGEAGEDCFQVYLGYENMNGEMAFTNVGDSNWNPTNPSFGCETLSLEVEGLW